MIVRNTENVNWALVDSSEWGDNDILAYCRRGKDDNGDPNDLPEEGDVITAEREDTEFQFVILKVFRSVGRTRTVPMVIQATA